MTAGRSSSPPHSLAGGWLPRCTTCDAYWPCPQAVLPDGAPYPQDWDDETDDEDEQQS